ncbi:hypothetical protein LTR17_012166 [Elasticomyces elasticus]|nr:hypothetical protein LTR17_012166 [Elasticomyces elasticus]
MDVAMSLLTPSSSAVDYADMADADSILLRNDSVDVDGDRKPLIVVHSPGCSLQRHYKRGLMGTCVPLVLTAYYLLIWAIYLSPVVSPNDQNFGLSGAQLVLYSWTILSVVGLDLGEYGLLGAEASMLMTTFWAAPNAWHLMVHGEHAWSGIDGWIDAVKSLFGKNRRSRRPNRLWWVLASITALLFLALPLTGLTMELKDGYRKTSTAPSVLGQNWTTFNQRSGPALLTAAHNAWSLAVPPRVPGIGMLYTNSSKDRKNLIFSNLKVLPNTIPADPGVDEVFLAPQAYVPISGKTWGMIVRYNCTVVRKLEDFAILSRRNGSKSLPYWDTISDPDGLQAVNTYDVGPHSINIRSHNDTNYSAVSELAYSPELYGSDFFSHENSTQCYFNKSEGANNGYPGLEHDSLLELAIWQYATNNEALVNRPLPSSFYNFSIDTTVAGLSGAYSTRSQVDASTVPMDAIGLQCRSSSAVGIAEVDGKTATYQNFERSDTEATFSFSQCAPRLSLAVPKFIFQENGATSSWAEDFFTSVEAAPLFLTAMSDDPVVTVTVRPTLLQASELRISLLRAYGTAAAQLMFDGGQGWSYSYSSQRHSFTNFNATSYEKARVLGQGPISPMIPAVPLVLWALGSCLLSVLYGFERRWADNLDSFSLFQFGGDASDKVKEMPASAVKDFTDHEQMIRLPGLVGDSRPGFNPGHVTLVDYSEARKGKKYV